MIYLLIGYMWIFIHRPFEIYQWMGTIHIERLYMGVTILYWALFYRDKTWVHNRLNLAFGFLWVVVLLAWLSSPYQDADRCSLTVQNYLKLVIFYLLVMASVRTDEQTKLLMWGFLVSVAIYMTHSFYEFRCGRHEFRQGIPRMIGVDETANDPNTFASSILYAISISLAFWPSVKTRNQRWFLWYTTGLAAVCVVLTGSRSAFVGLILFVLFCARRLFSRHKKLALVLVLVAPLGWFVLPENLQGRFTTLVDDEAGPKEARDSAKGRLRGLYDGISLWEQSPVLGVGPGAHGLAMGHGFQAHNVYGQVLGETGTLGALALLSVVVCFLLNGLEISRLHRQLGPGYDPFPAHLSSSVLFALFLLLVKGYSDHNLYRYNWMWFGAFQAIALDRLRAARSRPSEDVPSDAEAFEGGDCDDPLMVFPGVGETSDSPQRPPWAEA